MWQPRVFSVAYAQHVRTIVVVCSDARIELSKLKLLVLQSGAKKLADVVMVVNDTRSVYTFGRHLLPVIEIR